jgi:DNA polymerase (family 10)
MAAPKNASKHRQPVVTGRKRVKTWVSNGTIAGLLRRYAGVIALQGANRFKVNAYRRAAETVEATHEDITGILARGSDLTELPAIGEAISAVISEIARSGTLPRLDKAASELAPGLIELAEKPGLDTRTISRLNKKLGISTLAELQKMLVSGKVREVLGQRVDFRVRQALDDRSRTLLWAAEKLIPGLTTYLVSVCGATRVESTGSLRRKKDTVSDLGFLITGRTASAIFKAFAKFGAVQSSHAIDISRLIQAATAERHGETDIESRRSRARQFHGCFAFN